jgi:ribosomal-protein-alanine N-acetyltransferase
MRLSDLEQVHKLEEIIFPTPWSMRSYQFEVADNIASDPWVAELNKGVSQSIILAYIVPWIVMDELHIANIAVDPGYRRSGLGKQLLADTLLRAQDRGVKIATLEVRSGNLAAQSLYASLGFEHVGRRKHYYEDNREDALIFRLENIDKVKAHGKLEAI